MMKMPKKENKPQALPKWVQAVQVVLILAIFWTLFRDAYNVAPVWTKGMVNAISWVFFVQAAPPYILNYIDYLKHKWGEKNRHTKTDASKDARRSKAIVATEPAKAN